MKRNLLCWHRNEKGITGLETAIILIAFVVVAAVFAYTVLSAGLFSTQKSSEAVYSGLKEASNTIVPRGSVIAYQGDNNLTVSESVGKVTFTISNSSNSGTEYVDLTPPYTLDAGALSLSTLNTPTQITFTDANVTVPRIAWTLDWVGKHSDDNLLEPGELAVITVWLHDFDGTDWSDGSTANGFIGTNGVDTYHTFTLEVKTPDGAVLPIQRTTPALLSPVMDLH